MSFRGNKMDKRETMTMGGLMNKLEELKYLCPECGHRMIPQNTNPRTWVCPACNGVNDLRELEIQRFVQNEISLENRTHLLKCILAERDNQDRKHGGPTHDDTHHFGEWIDFIKEHCSLANCASSESEQIKELTQIAALALAALESRFRLIAPKVRP